MKNRTIFILQLMLIGIFFNADVGQAEEAKGNSKNYYRYTNESGTKVVGQTIPPQYVRAGYEIVNINGVVLKVVPASPSDADAERIAQERKAAREQARADIELRRSYSNTNDIEITKNRILLELRSNIDLLKANLFSVNSQLKNQEKIAATLERNGQKISDDLLKNITNLHTEENEISDRIKQREIAFKTVAEKYEQDKKRFIEINKTKSP